MNYFSSSSSRKRSHNIDDILGDQPQYNFDRHVKRVEIDSDKNEKFKMTRFKSVYVFEKVQQLADPFIALRQCFSQTIDDAQKHARENSYDPDTIGVMISSVNLDPDIRICLNKITENTVHSIFNRFLIIEQSKSKEQSLLGEPFNVEVTLVNKKDLPKESLTSGRGRQRNDNVRHKIDEKKLIIIENYNNNFCLFQALEVMRAYIKDYITDRTMTSAQFCNYRNNSKKLCDGVQRMMVELKIDKSLEQYEAEIYCPMVEQYWSEKYGPSIFKIFIFDEYGTYRPIYASKNDEYRLPILIYHKDQHFNGIRTLRQFFNGCRNYCLSCSVPYDKP
jgi:hypothetical protein